MKKRSVCIFLILLLFVNFISFVLAETTTEKIDKYSEIVGENILKFQNFFMGALKFISFGAFGEGGYLAFSQFMFLALIFILIYEIVGFVPIFSKKLKLPIVFLITLLAFLFTSVEEITMMLQTYESMGIILTVVLPVLILLSFTFRIYQRAYEGKSETSPFYAEMFNLIFLIFFGIFFIRYSASEEFPINTIRFYSGILLIIFGIIQTLFYKIIAKALKSWIANRQEVKETMEIVEDINDPWSQFSDKYQYTNFYKYGSEKWKKRKEILDELKREGKL